jgi:hypothetical protein
MIVKEMARKMGAAVVALQKHDKSNRAPSNLADI